MRNALRFSLLSRPPPFQRVSAKRKVLGDVSANGEQAIFWFDVKQNETTRQCRTRRLSAIQWLISIQLLASPAVPYNIVPKYHIISIL